jgi:hypothetical protein
VVISPGRETWPGPISSRAPLFSARECRQNEIAVALLHGFDDGVAVGRPHRLVEDLHLDVSAVSGETDKRADLLGSAHASD